MADRAPAAPTGTPVVDILRHAVELPATVAADLRMWELSNGFVDDHTWPLRINWADRSITYWPDVAGRDGPFVQTLLQVPGARLWPALAAAGALWCANPDHASPAPPAACRYQVDRAGEHLPAGVAPVAARSNRPGAVEQGRAQNDAALNQAIEFALTVVLDRAVPSCEHPDPGGPIYGHTRACVGCCVAAIMELMAGPHPGDQATRDRLRAAVTGGQQEVVVGRGYVPGGDPTISPASIMSAVQLLADRSENLSDFSFLIHRSVPQLALRSYGSSTGVLRLPQNCEATFC